MKFNSFHRLHMFIYCVTQSILQIHSIYGPVFVVVVVVVTHFFSLLLAFCATHFGNDFSAWRKIVLRNKLARCFYTVPTDTFCTMNYDADQNGAANEYHFPLCHYLLSFRVFETFISVLLLFPTLGHYSWRPLARSLARSLVRSLRYFHWFKHPKTFHVHIVHI